ncbi:transcriptional regulator [Sulfolobus sp. A20-N-G8]|nr:transcriptional regulator [Sulfolobus sp. A20-N-G8]
MLLKIEEIFQNKGWETRKKILNELKNNPQSAYELARKLNLNYSTIKYHLEILEKFGLIMKINKGSKSLYRVTKNYNLLEKYIIEEE